MFWTRFVQRALFQISAAIVFFLAISGGDVLANSAGGQADPRDTPWADENQYQGCGQSCVYQKGNEVITLDATYTLEKIDRIKALDADDVFNALRGFCSSEETGDQCRDRYIAAASRSLFEARNSIGRNEGSARSLSDHRGTSSRPDTRKKGLKPQVASVITWDRVKEKISSTPTRPRSRDVWLREVAPRPPNEADFVVFRPMPRDPSDPSAGTFMVPDTTPKGLAEQKKAYQEALAAYQERIGDLQKKWEQNAQAKYNQADPDPKLAPDEKSLEFDAFRSARRRVIGAVNDKLEQLGMVSKKEKPERGLAASTKPDAQKGSAKDAAPPKPIDLKIQMESGPAANAPKPVPLDAAEHPDDRVRAIETSDDRDDFVTVGWNPDELTKAATYEMRKTPPPATPGGN